MAENDIDKKIEKIQKLKKTLKTISNIEEVKDIINNQLLKGFNENLIKDFIEKYRLLKEEMNSFKEKHIEIIEKAKKDFERPLIELEE